MEPKTDGICGKLRDLGIFFIGIAAVVFTTFYIWSQLHSPEREMQAAMQKSLIKAMADPGAK